MALTASRAASAEVTTTGQKQPIKSDTKRYIEWLLQEKLADRFITALTHSNFQVSRNPSRCFAAFEDCGNNKI